MDRDAIEQEGFEQDFAAAGELEYEEVEWNETELDMELLVSRVQAARMCGA